MTQPVVFIAPRGVDVSEVAQSVGEKLNLPVHTPHDYFTDAQRLEMGYDPTAEVMAFAQGGAYANYRLSMAFRLRAMKWMLKEIKSGLIIIPPDYAVYEDPELLAKMIALLASVPVVVRFIPSADADENAALLDADLAHIVDWNAVNAYWVNNPSNERLAKVVVYTKDRTEAETRDEILAKVSSVEPSEIILIGPKLTGKTTIGRMLADALHLPQVSLDDIGRDYLSETDFDLNTLHKVDKEEGIFGALRYMRPYEAHMVERALQDHHHCVMDFGGGHSVYDDDENFQRVQKALAPYSNVILLLPSPDKAESIRILSQRWEMDVASERKLQRLLVTHDSFQRLAKQTVYTKDKTLEAISDEALKLPRASV